MPIHPPLFLRSLVSKPRNTAALLSVATVVLLTAGCASEPPAPPAPPPAPAPVVVEPTMSEELRAQLGELTTELTSAGVVVSETQDRRIKLLISSDASFASGRSNVNASFGKLLQRLAASLVKYPKTQIEIVGHTDNTSGDSVNLPLSVKRAEAARDYLVARKVAADRFNVQGWGPDQPVADNDTAEGRAKNRRVEMFVFER